MIFCDFTVKGDLLKVSPIKRQTKGEDTYNTFKTNALEINSRLHKVSAIATDGAPGMLGSINGFIELCKKDESFPDFISYRCLSASFCVVLSCVGRGLVMG
jgi:hypothetical protein